MRRCPMKKPATKDFLDCPRCPACRLPVGVTYDRDELPLPAPRLYCPACGHQWDASAADRAQAEAADAAWAVERARQYALPGVV